jgi:hypothetical protein
VAFDLCNRHQVEHFLRNASADELHEQLGRLRSLPVQSSTAIAGDVERLIARIGYELRFRVPLPV